MSEREKLMGQERDYCCLEIIFMFSGFTFGADSIYAEVVGFSPLCFPRGNSLCLLSLVFIVVHVILSVKDPNTMLA